jgi:DNA-binding NarL/FixJ family response regulator
MNVVIVDDHRILCDLVSLVCTSAGHQVMAIAETGEQAVRETLRTRPEIVILDLALPDMDGFAVAAEIQRNRCRSRFIAVSGRCDASTVLKCEQAGFVGFVDKAVATISDFKLALESIEMGRRFFSSTFLSAQRLRRTSPVGFDKLLTQHQQDILALIGDTLNDDEIARCMALSPATVEKHRFRIMKILGLHTREDLLRYSRQNGFTASTRFILQGERFRPHWPTPYWHNPDLS